MIRLSFNTMRLPLSFMSSRAAHSSSFQEKRFATIAAEDKTRSVALGSISDYANIFTREGDKIFIHANIPSGKPPEKRMTFVKLYMFANHLIGNRCILLSNLTSLCNREGYRSIASNGNKTSKVKSGNFKSSFLSNRNKRLFQLTSNEDGKTQVSLTDRGVQKTQSLADRLNSIYLEEPQGRLKDVLTIFKKEGFLREGNPVSIKKLGNACEKSGYTVELGNLRYLLSAHLARQFFVFDRDRDAVKLSPLGIKMVEILK
ncbi:hypothetical protein [Candidatus Neptunichlamydia sp. REUL1]|uniref:hypothetical protein n=1 Tax=Candidatus Neptunichlamydia sp. REUL1 TaxID=3064277 RepID=UPI002931440E|nr:hypothetical protein [Candidatus Neptunochlamydia sp. REUL1]